MLCLIVSSGVRTNDLCSQTKAPRKKLQLHRMQQCRKLRGHCEPAALFLHLWQEGRHLTEGLHAHLIIIHISNAFILQNKLVTSILHFQLLQSACISCQMKKENRITSALCWCCNIAKVMAFGSTWLHVCPPGSDGEEAAVGIRFPQTKWNTWLRIGKVSRLWWGIAVVGLIHCRRRSQAPFMMPTEHRGKPVTNRGERMDLIHSHSDMITWEKEIQTFIINVCAY